MIPSRDGVRIVATQPCAYGSGMGAPLDGKLPSRKGVAMGLLSVSRILMRNPNRLNTALTRVRIWDVLGACD